MNLYLNLSSMKAELGIPTGETTQDAFLLRLLERASRLVDKLTDRRFYVELATKALRKPMSGYYMAVPDFINLTEVKVEGSVLPPADYEAIPYAELPKTGIRRLDAYIPRFAKVELTGKWGYSDEWLDSGATGTVADGATKILGVSSTTPFSIGDTILCEGEQMYVEAIGENELMVRRGINGTMAAAHAAKPVSIYCPPPPIAQAVAILTTRWYRGRDAAWSGEVGTEGALVFPASVPREVRLILSAFKRYGIVDV